METDKKCKKCNNPMKDTPSMKYGRFSDNEHPRSPLVWFCNCGKTTTMDKDVTNNEHTI